MLLHYSVEILYRYISPGPIPIRLSLPSRWISVPALIAHAVIVWRICKEELKLWEVRHQILHSRLTHQPLWTVSTPMQGKYLELAS
jgi:hypothetical protein